MAELCDICGVRPATVRARVSRNGETEVLNLCDLDYRRLAARQTGAPDPFSPDLVDEALEESFPASDPPAWAGHGAAHEVLDPPDPNSPRPETRRRQMARNLPAPFRFVEEASWAPFGALQREMSRLFDVVAREGGAEDSRGGFMAPRLDVRETDTSFRVSVELPGVREDDVDIEVDDDLLTIRAEKREERELGRSDQHVLERRFGVLQRSIRLPEPVDADTVKARLENGVLQIEIPKSERQARKRRIQVSGARPDEASRASGSHAEGAQAAAQSS